MTAEDGADAFGHLSSPQSWTLFVVGLLMSAFYIGMLVLTLLNVLELKERIRMRVLLRSQLIMIMIEALRLVAATLCVI